MSLNTGPLIIKPQPGPQEVFLSSSADIAIFGGSNGGGKTFGLLMEPLRHINNPQFGAVIFRRTTPQITNEGGLWDESRQLYPKVSGVPIRKPLQWTFPAGSKVTMMHLQYEDTIYDWDGAQVPLLLFDQLEQFTGKQFLYMLGRNRSTSGIKPYVRATCNPDPDTFLYDPEGKGRGLIDWWIDEEGYPIPERSGVVRWFCVISDTYHHADTKEELIEQLGPDCEPLSLTFISSTVYDNKILMAKDPGYVAKLKALPEQDQMRKLRGNWKFRSEGGLVKREHLIHLKPGEPMPDMVRVIVAVDPSGSSENTSSEVGIVVAGKGVDGRGYVIDDISGILTPAQWANRAINAYNYYGADLIVGERNFGGDMVASNIKGVDRTVNYKDVHASRGKMVRWEPISAFYTRGEISHCKYLAKLESQICSYNPETFEKSPDRLDAMVWAFTELLLVGDSASQTKLRGH